MARINTHHAQLGNAFRSGFGMYDFGTTRPAGVMFANLRGVRGQGSGLGQSCPEGSYWNGSECACYEGRVWLNDKSKCVSPQSSLVTGAITWQDSMVGHTPTTYGQQDLTPAARQYIESKGHRITCKIDPSWFFGPQGGTPAMLCSIDGGPYEHGAYAINLNPQLAIDIARQTQAAQQVSQATGIAPGALYATAKSAQLLQQTAATGTVDAALAAEAKVAQDLQAELRASLVPGLDFDPATNQSLSWRADIAWGPAMVDTKILQDALGKPPGTNLPGTQGDMRRAMQTGAGYATGAATSTGQPTGAAGGAGGAGALGGALGDVPTWAWLGAAGLAAFVLMGKK